MVAKYFLVCSLRMASKIKKRPLEAGHCSAETISYWTSKLADHGDLDQNNPARLVDAHSLGLLGLDVDDGVKPPEFVVLVDRREKGSRNTSHLVAAAPLCSALLRCGVWAVPWTLPDKQGDYAILQYSAEPVTDVQEEEDDDGEDDSSVQPANVSSSSSPPPPVDTPPKYPPGYKVMALIERKTPNDLADSIKNKHRSEQRREMLNSGVPVLVWMITGYVDQESNYFTKQLLSAIFHDTFSTEGLDSGQKICALQLSSDACVVEALSNGVRRIAECAKAGGASRGVSMEEYATRLKRGAASSCERYEAALRVLVPGLGEVRSRAVRAEYPSLVHLCKAAQASAGSARKRKEMVERLSDALCESAQTGGKKRRLGKAAATNLTEQLISPYEQCETERLARLADFSDDDD